MHTSKNHAVAGDLDSNGMPVDECRFKKLENTYLGKKKVLTGTIFGFNPKDILTYKEDGKTYYLKGIREKYIDREDDNKFKDYAGFSIYDSLNKDPITGTKGVKTDLYAKVGKKYTGIEKDTITNREFRYSKAYKIRVNSTNFEIKDDAFTTGDASASDPMTIDGGISGVLKDKDTWENIADYMARDLCWKNTVDDNRIYLVYQEAPKAEVTLTKEIYEYDDETGKHECNGNKTTKTWDLKKGTTKYSLEQFRKDHDGAAPRWREINEVRYYARYVKFSYTDKDGKEHEKTLDLTDFKVDGKEYGVFSGKDASKKNITKAVEKMYEKVTMNNLSPSTKIEITIKYYQPKTPTALVGYYQFYDENGEMQRVKLFETIRIYSLIRIVFLLTQEVGQFLLQTN